jgi:hypothetical protein
VAPDAAGDPPAACEAASDAAGCEAAADDADGDWVAPLEQAEATIATIANGAATRRNACLVVKLLSPQVDRLCLDNVDSRRGRQPTRSGVLLWRSRGFVTGPSPWASHPVAGI